MNVNANSGEAVIIGAGRHAAVVLDLVRACSTAYTIIGYIDQNCGIWGKEIESIPVLGGDDFLLAMKSHAPLLINAIGSVGKTTVRSGIHDKFISQGFSFLTLVHPFTWVSPGAFLGQGCQIMAGAVVQTGVCLGQGTIVNTGARVDHDCRTGKCCHIAPGVTLSGNVHLGDGVHLGTGATVIQGVSIGDGAVIGAGATVVSDIPPGVLAMGLPARVVRKL